MIKNMENIVDIKVHSKPQAILKRLLNGNCNFLQSNKNSKLLKRLGISSVNNSSYNPIIRA